MPKEKKASQKKHISNSKYHDSSSKLIFGNAELCSQFLRNYMDIPLLKNIRAEDIEDVTERYIPMFTEERNSDTVKRIRISEKDTLFFVTLIEHKTKVDYNVSMQLLRYMVYIWEDYEKEMERKKKGISRTKDFRYPPILPIVYYEGSGKWTAPCNIKDRIYFDEAFEPFTPKFFYKLVQLNDYSVGELVEKKDELSLLMLINRLQSMAAFRELNLPKDYLNDLSENSTDELLAIIARVTASMLRHLHLPEEEIVEFTDQIKERDMAVLFEYFEDVDLPAERKRAREEGHAEGRAEGLAEGRAEGLAEGHAEGLAEGLAEGRVEGLAKGRVEGLAEGRVEGLAEGLAEGESRFAKLTQLLLESGRTEDLTRAVTDITYRKELYLQNDL